MQKCTLIFAFRSCYCLGSFVLQDLFQVYEYLLSRDKIRNFPWTFFLLALYSYTPSAAVIKLFASSGRFLSRISYYLSSYVFLFFYWPGQNFEKDISFTVWSGIVPYKPIKQKLRVHKPFVCMIVGSVCWCRTVASICCRSRSFSCLWHLKPSYD